LPPDLDVADPEQALQQFLGQSTWNERAALKRYRAMMAKQFARRSGIFIIDDTTLPKQGTHSVGVARRHCGALGKVANCQCAVSVHYATAKAHFPLDMRLFLPNSWLDDPARLDKAGVPEEERRRLSKGRIALELLYRARAEELPGRIVVADAGYGVSGPFRDRLAQRGLSYIVGVTDDMVVFAQKPAWDPPGPADRPAETGGAGRGGDFADELEGSGGPDAEAGGDLARGDQGADAGPIRLAAGLAGRRLEDRRVRRRRAVLVVD